jgi:hypothetical protein
MLASGEGALNEWYLGVHHCHDVVFEGECGEKVTQLAAACSAQINDEILCLQEAMMVTLTTLSFCLLP